MKPIDGRPRNALFIYTKDVSGRFWVFDGSLYHHFFVDGPNFWYIRSQPYLPAYTSGRGYLMMNSERRALQREADRHHITLPFFQTVKECEDCALYAQQEQFIIDRTIPGGYFYIKNDMRRRNEDEQGE